MKLIEKKCPNCGSNLQFDKDDTDVTCKYCNASYEIQRDGDLDDLVKNVFDANDFILHRKMVSTVGRGIMFFAIFMFIVIFVIFLITFFNIFPKITG